MTNPALEWLEMMMPDDKYLTADNFDGAILGYVERFGMETIVLYDRDKCIEILMTDMSDEEAVEFFDFNVIGAWMGEFTPAFATLYRAEADTEATASFNKLMSELNGRGG